MWVNEGLGICVVLGARSGRKKFRAGSEGIGVARTRQDELGIVDLLLCSRDPVLCMHLWCYT